MVISLHSMSQKEKLIGVQFEKNLTWEQIKRKASDERKYIFVDCYATWCGPCKAMDAYVYGNDTVGEVIKKYFIAVKVQMDSTIRDDIDTKNWYKTAHLLQKCFNIVAYPSFLIFSPDGNVMHKDIGYKKVNDLITFCNTINSPEAQYYSLLHLYKRGCLPEKDMRQVAQSAFNLHDNLIAYKISSEYMHKYLDVLDESEFCTRANIEFINTFIGMVTSKDRIFKMCYQRPFKIDSVMVNRANYSRKFVDNIIYSEQIKPALEKSKINGSIPNWIELYKNVRRKYDRFYANRLIVSSKPTFYRYRKSWELYTKALVDKIEKYGLKDVQPNNWGVFYLNQNAWDIFLHSSRRKELKKALSWCEIAIPISTSDILPGLLDTKANLLYKLGKREIAISLESKIAVNTKNEIFIQNLKKMKLNEPTWVIDL